MISFAPGVRYVDEPFNVEYYPDINPVRRAYHYFSDQTKAHRQEEVRQYLQGFNEVFGRHFWRDLRQVRSVKRAYIFLADRILRTYSRPLYKDPFMLFAAPWLARELGADVIVTIRHPAAFVASLKVKNWVFDFGHFAGQRRLMREQLLAPYWEDIKAYAANPPDIIEQGILVWKCLYYKVSDYQEAYRNDPHWYFVRHEDLSLDPIEKFRRLFAHFGLPYSGRVQRQIRATSQSKEKSKIKRDSRSNLRTWQKRLSPEEIERIKAGTRDIWQHFYGEEDWE